MVKFSCFNAHIHCHKSKKSVQAFQPSAEVMHKTLEDSSHIQVPNDSAHRKSLNSFPLKAQGGTQTIDGAKDVSTSSAMRGWKSDEMKGKVSIQSDIDEHRTSCLKKSHSLGSGLYLEGRVSDDNDTEDGTDQGFYGSHDNNGLVVQDGVRGAEVTPLYQYQNVPTSESVLVSSDLVNNESSIFSFGDTQHLEKEGHENSDTPLSNECAGESSDHTPLTALVIVKSRSSPNIGVSTPTSGGCSLFNHLAPRSRSCEDLHVLGMRRKDNSIHEVDTHERERDVSVSKAEKIIFENPNDDGYDSYSYVGLAKDWVIPEMDEVNSLKNLQGESSVPRLDKLPSKDFKTKRIEEWVTDLQHCNPLEETIELNHSNYQAKNDHNILNGLTATKVDAKATPVMEAAKKYISSLTAAATSAQLANHGLVVIPFLSAFVSLRVLNLSGNSIVRITAGALPRGLHMLNLSKNNISTIEGLRELTRLRVLDLSYNRIIRIGHGLASCSSLKELYLAGNKISEVEGLHRLLKLTVLDLRYNKISTAKCLGQLAANYNSLQAISLEGNPAQKNVGDEQVKKYLQGLLPHLVYFNRQAIKVSTLKDAADRSVRLGIGAHQFDRGLRSEHKVTRKGSHGLAAAHRPSSSSTHGRKSQAVVSPKRSSKGRHVRLPPSGTKPTTSHRHNYFDFGSKMLNFRPDLAMRKSRSEGMLGAL